MSVDMERFWKQLDSMGNMETLVLATSKDDLVTSRPIGALRYDNSILIRTGGDSQKAKQVRANPHVAVCMGAFYLQGKARILGLCTDLDNPEVQKARDLYQKRWPDAFSETDNFLSGDEVFILITPTNISQWVYEGEEIEGLFHLDLEENEKT